MLLTMEPTLHYKMMGHLLDRSSVGCVKPRETQSIVGIGGCNHRERMGSV